MQEDAFTPLCLADLEEEEALMVWLYRHWQDQGPTPEAAELRLSGLLRRDSIHGLLGPIFSLFRDLGPDEEILDAGRPTLTAAEWRLLGLLTDAEEASFGASAASCRAALAEAGVSLRPPHGIARSEIALLERAVSRSSPPFAVWS